MPPKKPIDIDKIKQLIATATTPKQKLMYQKLLSEAEQKLSQQQQLTPVQEPKKEVKHSAIEPVELVVQQFDVQEGKKPDKSNTLVQPIEENRTTPMEAEEDISAEENPMDEEDEDELNEDEESSNEYGSAFQAVGVVQGKLILDESEKFSLELGSKNYPLFYANSKFWAYKGLKKQIAKTGKNDYPLMVYPKITHFPQKNQPHNLYFQLVAFNAGNRPEDDETIFKEINNNEFKIFGLWQFIPPCRLPCISVFRNYSPKLLEYIKQGDLSKKVKITKATHVPIIWKESPVQPFRFNPKLKKEEQQPLYFVTIKAKFIPENNLFLFIEQLAPPTETVPRFIKTSKQDKMELNRQKNKSRQKTSSKKSLPSPKKFPKNRKKPAPKKNE